MRMRKLKSRRANSLGIAKTTSYQDLTGQQWGMPCLYGDSLRIFATLREINSPYQILPSRILLKFGI